MRIFTVCFQRWCKVRVDSALDRRSIFYVGTGYLCRLDRSSGFNSRIADRLLVSAVEEVKVQSCSGFSIPVNPWTCGIHWLNDGAVEKQQRAAAIMFVSGFSRLGILLLDLFCCLEGLLELMPQLKFIQRAALPSLPRYVLQSWGKFSSPSEFICGGEIFEL